MAVFELLGKLGTENSKTDFMKLVFSTFITYLNNTAAMVRTVGVQQSKALAEIYGEQWIVESYIPQVQAEYMKEKKGYNYRICYINSLAEMMPFLNKENIN